MLARALQFFPGVNRNRILALLAALIVPGGLLALLGLIIVRIFSRSERGQRALERARRTVPAWAAASLRFGPQRFVGLPTG